MQGSGPAPVDPLGTILGSLAVSRRNPVHPTFTEEVQFVAKVQRFGEAPPELVVRPADFGAENDRLMKAYRRNLAFTESGATINVAPPGVRKRSQSQVRSDDTLRASAQRSKTKCRAQVMQLMPSMLLTLTTRKVYPLDVMWQLWARFCKLMETADPGFRYVVVPQEHPDGLPDHWHLHSPCRTVLNHAALRRLWHIALEAHEGRRITRTLKGDQAPGNVDDGRRRTKDGRLVSWGADPHVRSRRMAGYVGRYISKQFALIEFNKKRYALSRDLGLPKRVKFYLQALTFEDAVREACSLVGSTLPDGSPMLANIRRPPSVDVLWANLGAAGPPPVLH
jgi:hypothetical protein